MRNNKHDNKNTEQILLLDLLAKSLKTVIGGKINIEMEAQPAINIDQYAVKIQ